MVEEVGAASAAVEVPGDDGVLGGGVDAAAPALEHALPLEPLHEQQPHPGNAPPPAATARPIDGSTRRSEPTSAGALSPSQQPRIDEEKKLTQSSKTGKEQQERQGTGPGSGSQERKER